MTERWSSRAAFLFAATGASIGIGNIWKFPYMTGANGGSAFVAVYLACVVIIAIPLLIAELHIGRRAGMGPPLALLENARLEGRSRHWAGLGWLFMLTGFLILSFFSVVSGWILDYLFTAVFHGFTQADARSTHDAFAALLASPLRMTTEHFLFTLINVVVVSFGVKRGIERLSGILMPTLLVLLLMMVCYSFASGAPMQALHFLFRFEPERITSEVLLMAAGQSFLSVGLCSGMMMICGAYMPRQISIPRTAVIIALTDTLVALLAGLMIFPLVFGYGLQPAQGPGLIFETLPIAFGLMPMGYVFGIAFFLLLFFASVTSSVALLEYLVSWLITAFGLGRVPASLLTGSLAWCVGLLTVFSFNILADVRPLGFLPGFTDASIFAVLDYLATNVLLVGGGFLLALFSGWFMHRQNLLRDLDFKNVILSKCWYFALRYLATPALALVILSTLRD